MSDNNPADGFGAGSLHAKIARQEKEIEELRKIYEAARRVFIAHSGQGCDNETKGLTIKNLHTSITDVHKSKKLKNEYHKPNIEQ